MSDDNMAIDSAGKQLLMTSDEVKGHIARMIDDPDSDILAVVIQNKNGDLAVPVFGPPSEEVMRALQTAATGYRRALRRARLRNN